MTPRDYFAKGWPGDQAVIDQFPLHTGVTGEIEMFMAVEFVTEGGVLVVQQAAATAGKIYIAIDAFDAYDVQSASLLPIWLNSANKVIVTPHVDVSGLAIGDEVEVKAAGLFQKKASNPAVGKVVDLLADDDVRVLLY